MCGKFTQMMAWETLAELADILRAPGGAEVSVTPVRFASVICLNACGGREVARMRWGLVPPGAKDPITPAKHIHARAETIEIKPTFREAFFHRRGLLVVKSFNEGKEISPSKTEQHVITANDGQPMAIAVIWDRWVSPDQGTLLNFAMVTVPANSLIGEITDRMPAVLALEHWGIWLGEEPATVDELKSVLTPFEGDWTMRPQAKTPPKPQGTGPQQTLF